MKYLRFKAVIKLKGCDNTILAYSITDLKRKGSRIANSYFNSIDTMIVTERDKDFNVVQSFSMTRINRKYPNGRIERGVWK